MEFQTSAEKEENNRVQVSSKEMWGGHSILLCSKVSKMVSIQKSWENLVITQSKYAEHMFTDHC
jgi:hypothetical protein